MRRLSLLVLLTWSLAARCANIDEFFASGAFGLPWGASLKQVQAAFPDGISARIEVERYGEDLLPVSYEARTDVHVLGIATPCSVLAFLFTRGGALTRVACDFKYAERDAALFQIAEVLGQEFRVRDEENGRIYTWPSGKAAIGAMNIGQMTPFEWAYFSIRQVPRMESPKKGR